MFFYAIISAIVFVCFFFSLIYLRDWKAGWFFHFTWFLLLSFLVEFSGFLIYFVFRYPTNHWLFNLFMPVEFCFIGWTMIRVFKPLFDARWLIGIVLAVFGVFYLWESLPSHFLEYSSDANCVFSMCMVVLCLTYYYYLLRSEEYVNVYRHEDFWIVTGLFIFYFVQTASNFFFEYTVQLNRDVIKPIRYDIHILLNGILYTCWIYAFICRYKNKISS